MVVTPDDLRPALDDWSAHRVAQGHEIQIVAPGDNVRATIRAAHAASDGQLAYVVLLGDVDRVPCAYRPADAIAEWEKDPRIATDAPYADVDDDGVPDLALGRVTADSVDECRAMLARSIAYEQNTDHGTWRRRLNVVAGVGGFGPQQDMALEMLMRLFMNRDVPPQVDLHFTYAKTQSPFCPPPSEMAATFIERINEGSLVTAYVGHGSARNVDRIRHGDRVFPILEARHVPEIAVRRGSPLLVFVACSTGSLDGEQDCLAEEALRRPAGPAAVIASSRVSTPYGNAILGTEMVRALFHGDEPTVGRLLLDVKRRMAGDAGDDMARKQIEAMAGAFYVEDAERRRVDRREHVLLYHLFGDPLLRLARPRAATLKEPTRGRAGEAMTIEGTSPIAGRVLVEVLPRRDRNARLRVPPKDDAGFRSGYDGANVRPVASAEVTLETAGDYTVELALPAELTFGRYLVRVFVEGSDGSALAGATVRIEPAR